MRSAVFDLASQPIINWSPNPKLALSVSGWAASGVVSSGRVSVNDLPNFAFAMSAETAGENARVYHASTVIPDGQYDTGAWCYSSVAGVSLQLRAGTSAGTISNTISFTAKLGWQWVTLLNFVPTNGTFRVELRRVTNSSGGSFTLAMTGCTVVPTGRLTTPVDGDTPGWKWQGSPNVSASIGYPYTLESIAGRPVALIDTLGGVVDLSGQKSTDGLSLYAVSQRLVDPSSSFATIAGVSPVAYVASGGDSFSISERTTALQWQIRVDTASSGAGFNQFGTLAAGGVGPHTYAATIPAGFPILRGAIDGTTFGTKNALVANDGLTRSKFWLGAASLNHTAVAAVLFDQFHSDETVKRVTAWLARRYGAPIPPGY